MGSITSQINLDSIKVDYLSLQTGPTLRALLPPQNTHGKKTIFRKQFSK